MKSRKIALYALPFALAAIVFFGNRSPEAPEVESVDAGSEGTEAQTSSPIPEGIEGTEVANVPDSPEAPLSPESTTPASSSSSGGPIPFERLSMTELEEVNLSNAGDQHSHKIREWKGRMQPTLSELKRKLESEGEEGVLVFSLPDATQIQVTRIRFESFGANQGVFTGKILGDTFGEVVLSYVNQAVAGSIHDYRNDAVWEIRNAGDGSQYIAQIDVSALGECGVCKAEREQ